VPPSPPGSPVGLRTSRNGLAGPATA
jgi:hypothetical protein